MKPLHLKCSKSEKKNNENKIIEITLRHGCSPVNLLYISRTSFLKNTSGRLLLKIDRSVKKC